MSQVQLLELGSVISIAKGKKHSELESPVPGAKRLIGIDDLRNDDLLRCTADRKGVEAIPSDVLIAWDGANAGTIGFGKSGYIGSTIARLRINPGVRFNTEFLALFLRSMFWYLRKTATGATIPHINRTALEGIRLPEIDLEDQIRIAHLLGKVERLIAQRKQHLQQLDDLLKSVFLLMFGDPIRNDRLWPTQKLESFIDPDKGISYGVVQRGEHVADGVPILRIRDIINESYIESELVRTDKKNSDKYSRTILEGGELLLSIRGTVGAVSVAPSHARKWNISREIAVIPVKSRINTKFLLHLMKSSPMQLQFASMIKGVAQSGLNLSEIRQLQIILPRPELQDGFSQVARKLEALVSSYRQSLSGLESLYGALSQSAFKGELDLSRVPLMKVADDQLAIELDEKKLTAEPDAINARLANLDRAAMTTPDGRKQLLQQSFTTWLQNPANQGTSSMTEFWRTARMNALDYSDEETGSPEFSLADYDALKKWVFDEIAQSRISQTLNTKIVPGDEISSGSEIVLRKAK